MGDSGGSRPFSKVHSEKRESIFFVMAELNCQFQDELESFLENDLNKKKKEVDNTIKSISENPPCSTGFLIRADGNRGFVLTCCHGLKALYSANVKLTKAIANCFSFKVLCFHQEAWLSQKCPEELYDCHQDNLRTYTGADITELDSEKDLLLLEVSLSELQLDRHLMCSNRHLPLKFAFDSPQPLQKVLMISWPPNLFDTVVSGEVIHQERRYSQLAINNKGYRGCLLEINILGWDGCSGSPILNEEGDVVALYHGRIGDRSFGIKCHEMENFLQSE